MLVKTNNYREGLSYELQKQPKSQQKTISNEAARNHIRRNRFAGLRSFNLSLRRFYRALRSWARLDIKTHYKKG
jgi:hypothetical protein